jgi:hypothetical protein
LDTRAADQKRWAGDVMHFDRTGPGF